MKSVTSAKFNMVGRFFLITGKSITSILASPLSIGNTQRGTKVAFYTAESMNNDLAKNQEDLITVKAYQVEKAEAKIKKFKEAAEKMKKDVSEAKVKAEETAKAEARKKSQEDAAAKKEAEAKKAKAEAQAEKEKAEA